MTLKAGRKAPTFTLPDQDGERHKLADYKGSWVLIYFYPKDNTPGCTKEACAIRDNWSAFKRLKVAVLGISPDPVKKHASFVAKFQLPFTLLADEEKKVVNKYGVWGLKKFMGREYEGTFRKSFLIDPDGKIAKVYDKVKPADHAGEVLADVRALKKKAAS